MKIRYDIQGLDCPHCALELEKRIAKLDSVNEASINFTSKLLIVDTHDEVDEEEFIPALQEVADNFEDGITIELRD